MYVGTEKIALGSLARFSLRNKYSKKTGIPLTEMQGK